jgi:glutaminyl-peptide cyclotransferase
MLGSKAVKFWFAIVAASGLATASAADFSGPSAMEFTRRAVEFGPRPSGSEANRQLQNYILAQLKSCKCEVSEDNFTSRGPQGLVPMKNILARFPGRSGRAVVITGHYDTKLFSGRKFVGASDGGSSTGLLLELARVLAGEPRVDDVFLVWFDGEEAFGEWSETDKLWGSRHLAAKWEQDGTLRRIKALINVDMIGDRDLNIQRVSSGNRALNTLVWNIARQLGYGRNFVDEDIEIDDDHRPFLDRGVPAIDLIDFDYAPWHTDADTLDKLSPQSLEAVGRVVMEAIRRLEKQ